MENTIRTCKTHVLVRIKLDNFFFFNIRLLLYSEFSMKKYTVPRLLYILLYKVYLSFKIAELLNGILKYDLYIPYFPVVLDVTLN